ncbi:MAG: hypothetical protein M1465_00295 [Candidatus Marsarchaeota archaeon]|nr:hypothetical protein [Candidatus Marsarchaeota archaeon]
MLSYELTKSIESREISSSGRARLVKKVFVEYTDGSFNISCDTKTKEEYGVTDIPQYIGELSRIFKLIPSFKFDVPGQPEGNTPLIYAYIDFTVKGESVEATNTKSQNGKKYNRDVTISNADNGPISMVGCYKKHHILEENDSKYFVNQELKEKIRKKLEEELKGSANGVDKIKKVIPESTPPFRVIIFRVIIFPIEAKNSSINYPQSKPTIPEDAKFLSNDDPSFCINYTNSVDEKKFYRLLKLDNYSIKNISFSAFPLKISGLEFYFLRMGDKNPAILYEEAGFFKRLKENYERLSNNPNVTKETNAKLNIICLKRIKRKTEVLFNYNLTYKQLANALNIKGGKNNIKTEAEAEKMLMESLFIYKEGKQVLWRDYLRAINRLLLYTKNPKEDRRYIKEIKSKFSKHMSNDRFEYVKYIKTNTYNKVKELKTNTYNKVKEYLDKSCFYLNLYGDEMSNDEEYAYAIGRIAGKYVQTKKEHKDTNNSLYDILTYSRYDYKTIQLVFNHVSKGLELSKIDDDAKAEVEQFIHEQIKDKPLEIKDKKTDFSYFFYRGLFESLGSKEQQNID